VIGRLSVHKVMLYALSTCGWCKKTKQFFDDNGIDYDYVYVDKLDSSELEQVMAEVQKWNPSINFPTVVVDDKTVVVGFRVDRLREVLEL
jgi:glutaredoxin